MPPRPDAPNAPRDVEQNVQHPSSDRWLQASELRIRVTNADLPDVYESGALTNAPRCPYCRRKWFA